MFATIIPDDLGRLLRGDLEIIEPDQQYQQYKMIGIEGYFSDSITKKGLQLTSKIEKERAQRIYYNTILFSFRDQLKGMLDQRGIRYWFYKGSALVELLYGDIAGRRISDLDILIHRDDLEQIPGILKELGGSYDLNFFQKDHYYHESESAHTYLGQRINIDWHRGLIQDEKFPIDYSEFIENDRIEYHIIALLLHFSNDIYRSGLKNIVDLYLIFTTQQIDYSFLFQKIRQFHLRHIAYVILGRLNQKCGLNIDLKPLKIRGWRKAMLDHIVLTPVFRINQLLLFLYVFESPVDYGRFLAGKLRAVQREGIKELIRSFKNII